MGDITLPQDVLGLILPPVYNCAVCVCKTWNEICAKNINYYIELTRGKGVRGLSVNVDQEEYEARGYDRGCYDGGWSILYSGTPFVFAANAKSMYGTYNSVESKLYDDNNKITGPILAAIRLSVPYRMLCEVARCDPRYMIRFRAEFQSTNPIVVNYDGRKIPLESAENREGRKYTLVQVTSELFHIEKLGTTAEEPEMLLDGEEAVTDFRCFTQSRGIITPGIVKRLVNFAMFIDSTTHVVDLSDFPLEKELRIIPGRATVSPNFVWKYGPGPSPYRYQYLEDVTMDDITIPSDDESDDSHETDDASPDACEPGDTCGPDDAYEPDDTCDEW